MEIGFYFQTDNNELRVVVFKQYQEYYIFLWKYFLTVIFEIVRINRSDNEWSKEEFDVFLKRCVIDCVESFWQVQR